MKVYRFLSLYILLNFIGKTNAQDTSHTVPGVSVSVFAGRTISISDQMQYREWMKPGKYVAIRGIFDFADVPISLEMIAKAQQYEFLGHNPSGPASYDPIDLPYYTTAIEWTGKLIEYRVMAGPGYRNEIGRSELRVSVQGGLGILNIPFIRTVNTYGADSVTRSFPKRTLTRLGAGYALTYRYSITDRLFAEANLSGCIIPYRQYADSGQTDYNRRLFEFFVKESSLGMGVGIKF
jgi:hypothetical protein